MSIATSSISAQAPTAGAPDKSSANGNRRVNVVFTDEQYKTLQQLAASQRISLSEALRQAIGISNFFVGANFDKGTQILLKKGDSVQELKLVR